MSRIELSLFIAAPPARVFDLARSIDAHVASTSATDERPIAGSRLTGCLDLGEEITWSARHFGVRQTLTSRITAFDRPRYFRDSMVEGAFARFDHDHWFEPERNGTIAREVFDFTAPLGPLGTLVDVLVLRRYMTRLLETRGLVLKRLAESDAWQRFVPDSA